MSTSQPLMPQTKPFKRLMNAALDSFFPPQCVRCQALVPAHAALCHSCWQGLHFITPPGCSCCGFPFEYDLGEGSLCGACIDMEPLFTKASSLFVFDEVSRHMLHKLKFEDQEHLAPILARWLIAHHSLGDASPEAIFIPVPLSRARLWKRRYNQSASVARQLAWMLKGHYRPQWLERVKHTAPQTGLNRKERLENVRGVFEVPAHARPLLADKPIWLVDDVMTTGATINSCCQALKKAGVAEIHVLTLARVVNA